MEKLLQNRFLSKKLCSNLNVNFLVCLGLVSKKIFSFVSKYSIIQSREFICLIDMERKYFHTYNFSAHKLFLKFIFSKINHY
jgi:hypothetical protein